VLARHLRGESRCEAFVTAPDQPPAADRDPVGGERRDAAVGEKIRFGARFCGGEEVEKHLFVVATQADHVRVRRREMPDPFDDAGGFRPAVDVVAEMDHVVRRRRLGREVGADSFVHFGEKVVASMHVADRIDA